MSYLSIADFLKAGQKSIDDENYWSALSVSLMLPSICSRLTYAGNEDYLNPNGKQKDYKSYTDWCKENISKDGWIKMCLGENYADVLYQLRCDIVHAGCANIESSIATRRDNLEISQDSHFLTALIKRAILKKSFVSITSM